MFVFMNACQNSKHGNSYLEYFFRGSLVWVCTVRLSFFSQTTSLQNLRASMIHVLRNREVSILCIKTKIRQSFPLNIGRQILKSIATIYKNIKQYTYFRKEIRWCPHKCSSETHRKEIRWCPHKCSGETHWGICKTSKHVLTCSSQMESSILCCFVIRTVHSNKN